MQFFFCSNFCVYISAAVLNKNKTYLAPLTAHLQPQVQTVDVDKDAQFQCVVSGHPLYEITWLHDGKPIVPRDNRIEVSSLVI